MTRSSSSAVRLTSHANGALNHSSKFCTELKMVGKRKLSKDHNSWRLFCIGVPVNRSLRRMLYLIN